MKVAFATVEKTENKPLNSIGSSRIRARWVAKYWPEAEEYRVGQKYDVMIFQKAYWREMLERFHGIKIFDLCDPDWLEPRPVIESIALCDAATTSTEALAEYLRHFIKDKPILCIPDRVDLEEHDPRGEHVGDAKTAVWFGYSHNAHYLTPTFDFLIEAGLELTVIANNPVSTPMGFDSLKMRNVPWNYENIHDEIKKHDLAILPVTANADYKGQFKSNNKVLTSWALGMPVVQVPEDIKRFMGAEARNAERELRLKEVKEKWDVRISVKEYQNLIEEIMRKKGK